MEAQNEKIITSIFDQINQALHHCLYIIGGDAETNPAYILALQTIFHTGQYLTDPEDIKFFQQKWEEFKKDLVTNGKVKVTQVDEYGPSFEGQMLLKNIDAHLGNNLDYFHQKILPVILEEMNIRKTDFRNEHSRINWKDACSKASGQGLSPWLFLD